MNHIVTEGIVLRRVNYGEADRITTILTAKLGKIGAMARGVRRLNSKLAGGLELLSLNQFSLIKGKSELYTVSSARAVAAWDKLLTDYDLLQDVYRLLKFLDSNIEEGEGQPEFDLLQTCLSALNEQKNNSRVVLNWSYLRFLLNHGRQPDLKQDSTGQPLNESTVYNLSLEDGHLIPDENGRLSAVHIKFWRLCLTNDLDVVLNIKGVGRPAEETFGLLKDFVEQVHR